MPFLTARVPIGTKIQQINSAYFKSSLVFLCILKIVSCATFLRIYSSGGPFLFLDLRVFSASFSVLIEYMYVL